MEEPRGYLRAIEPLGWKRKRRPALSVYAFSTATKRN
jgi:hypothetical protein